MDLKDYLTNEKIRKKFDSQFELVNYAIKLAGNMIETGRDARVKIDSQNRAMQILTEILQGKDQFDEVLPKQEPTPAYHFSSKDKDLSSKDNDDDDDDDEGEIVEKKTKAKERKKTRKILAD